MNSARRYYVSKPAVVGAANARSAASFAEYYAFADINNLQVHGFQAEHMNHFFDTVAGRNATHIGYDKKKGAADRIVDGVSIQVKYCQKAVDTLNAIFDPKLRTRLEYVEGGMPMKVEVPKDQHAEVVRLLRERIKAGRVDGIADPEMADKIIKRGHYTYQEAKDVLQPGTIAGLKYDVQTGAITGALVGIASLVWRTIDSLRAAYARDGVAITLDELVKIVLANLTPALEDAAVATAMHVAVAQLHKYTNASLLRGVGRPAAKQLVGAVGEKGRQNLSRWLLSKPLAGAAASSYLTRRVSEAVVGGTVAVGVAMVTPVAGLAMGKITATECVADVGIGVIHGAVGGGGWTTGMAAGAALGSVVPGFGTAVGGFIGGLVGMLSANAAVSYMLPTRQDAKQSAMEQGTMQRLTMAAVMDALDLMPDGVSDTQWAEYLADAHLEGAIAKDIEMLRFASEQKSVHLTMEEAAPRVAAVIQACRERVAWIQACRERVARTM